MKSDDNEVDFLGEVVEALTKCDMKREVCLDKMRKLRTKLRGLLVEESRLKMDIESRLEETVEVGRRLKEMSGERGGLIRRIKYLKGEKQVLLNKLRENKARLRFLRLPKVEPSVLKEELERQELIYETSTSDPREEKVMMERIKKLSRQVAVYKEHETLTSELKSVVQALEEIEKETHRDEEKINVLTTILDDDKKRTKSLLDEATDLQVSLDKVRREITNKKREKDKIGKELELLKSRKKEILGKIGLKDLRTSPNEVKQYIEERKRKTKAALEKLRRGKPLRFEEFSTLVDEGMV